MRDAAGERDYVLGTHDAEIDRLGLQHRAWRPTALGCWQNAGITRGARVLDVGAGPGFASLDLAEIVEADGEVVAVERSSRFARAGSAACRARGLDNVRFLECDLMETSLPVDGFDYAWVRWVACFVSSPATLVARLAPALRPGGRAIFHEYIDYASWRLIPRSRPVDEFIRHVMETWREAGGEPDVAFELPPLLAASGFRVCAATPRVFCLRPRDHMWLWLAKFIRVGIDRLIDLGRVDEAWAARARDEFDDAESNPDALMVTPMVLEIVAERMSGQERAR